MTYIRDGIPFEVLIEVIAAHDGQSLDGTPESRVEGRIVKSMELAREAGFSDLVICLDRQDLDWLCTARAVERFSGAGRRMRIGGALVVRAGPDAESHLLGRRKWTARMAFPIIAEPSLTPGFVSYCVTDADKADLLHSFRADVLDLAVDRPENGKWN